jgi:hypothetical protein
MQLSLTQSQAILFKKVLRSYNTGLLTTYEEWKEYDNLFDKLADLSDTSRADDFYKQSKKIKNGRDLDSL